MTAVVTGAGSGIGRAIALSLAGEGVVLGLVGRRPESLEAVAEEVRGHGAGALPLVADLVAPGAVAALAAAIAERLGTVDLLVHAAWVFPFGPAEAEAVAKHPDAALELSRALLPLLVRKPGQIVFVNSSQGRPAGTAVGVYAESKQRLRALADHLRGEVNESGIRVLTVYPGRTATPMQAAIHRAEGRPYRPELLLQPEDVAAVVAHAIALPARAEVTDVMLRPTRKL